ncbi:MAG: hypothetical protein E5Y02_00350 [Mesorhizobium sp.]|nr:MAG: hypothetical protein E5Y02_00350 [Mesorhizobium sp.]
MAYVVKDLAAALTYWTETMGVGPFVVIESSVVGRKVLHRGKQTAMETDLTFSYLGDVQIELICQLNDAPSPYKEFTDSGREGLHHVAFWPASFDAACASGMGPLQRSLRHVPGRRHAQRRLL